MTTLLPILLALGMHPAQTTCQPAPDLMPVLTAIREDDLAYTVIILIALGLLAWFVLRIGADIINSILGTGRKQ